MTAAPEVIFVYNFCMRSSRKPTQKLYTSFVCDFNQRKSMENYNMAIKLRSFRRFTAVLEWQFGAAIKQNG